MAYNRRLSKAVMTLNALAWVCDHWPLPLILILIFSPWSPHVLADENSNYCGYLGSRGFVTRSKPPEQRNCHFITLIRIY